MSRRAVLLAFLLAVLGATLALFSRQSAPPREALDALAGLAGRPDIVQMLARAQPVPQSARLWRDKAWREQAAQGGPLIDGLLQSPVSRQLAQERAASNGHIRQIMVMDSGGALVAADAATHDYDQSDEPKWQRTVAARQTGPVTEGWTRAEGGIVWQMSQSVRAADGRMVGAVTLRWR